MSRRPTASVGFSGETRQGFPISTPQAARLRSKTARAAPGWRLAAASAVTGIALAGCASSQQFAARVTTFQHWPADAAGASYRIVGPAPEALTLEQQNYQDILRDNLSRIGLVEARPWARDARFSVRFSYDSAPFQTWEEVAAPFYGPTYSYGYFGYGRPGWGYGMAFPFGGYGPAYTTVPITAYRHSLDVSIRDTTQNGAEVFQARASHDSRQDILPAVMPYLVEAVFQDFPYGNGQVRTVVIPREP